MKFSCVMTAYNEGPLLAQSVASVLNQTHEDLELIIVDDGGSAETKAELAKIADPRVKIVEQSNDGLSSARNRGMRHCTGDYVCFLDADDTRAPWAFAEAAEMIEATGAELVLVRGVMTRPHGKFEFFMDEVSAEGAETEAALKGGLDMPSTKAWAASFEPQSANKFLSRDLIERGKLSFPNGHFFEDILFHTMAVAHARSIELLKSRSFTYFHRQLRPQLTGSNQTIRYDIIGVATVTFQLFAAHPAFANERFRGAVSIGVLRLLRWCEQTIALERRASYQAVLRQALLSVDPRFLVISEDTPDPRDEREALQDFVRERLELQVETPEVAQ